MPPNLEQEILSSQAQLKQLECNKGFGGNINAAVADLDGDVLLSNDDVVCLTPNWPELIRETFAADPKVAAVGATSNYVLEHQIAQMPRTKEPEVRWVNSLSFFWIAIRREAWDDVGPLDESFGLGLCEDLDWCIRARERGWRLMLDERIFVWHWGSQTILQMADYEALDRANHQKLAEKHGR